MEKDIVYLVTKHGDKNNSIQLWSGDKDKVKKLRDIFDKIHALKTMPTLVALMFDTQKYASFMKLNLFLQGYSDNWIMLESWSDKEDLVLAFGEFCSKEVQLPFDII